MNLAIALELDKVTRFDDEYNGHKYWFEAKAEMVTPRFLQQVKEWDADPIKKAIAMSEVITAWDIDMNGEPFPPNAENLSRTPNKFLDRMLDKIAESWQGNPTKPDESPST
jgi:hypothetical protein